MYGTKNLEVTFIIAIVVLSLACIILVETYRFAMGSEPAIFSTDTAPYGTPYKNWLAKMWNWSASIPAPFHPFKGYTPEKCALHQLGPVWFLPPVPETNKKVIQSCTIPAGKAVAFDIESGECDSGLAEVKNDNDMVTCAAAGNLPAFISLQGSVDRVEIPNINQYRVQSDFFNITFPNDNVFDSKPGTFRAVVVGFFFLLHPLSIGPHVINYVDQVSNPTQPQNNHAKSVTWELSVVPSGAN
jgi:hypothetical protein